MKKIIVFALLLIISATSFSQQTKPSPALTKQDYLKKSKNQKTAAWLLLGGGAAITTLGIALGTSGVVDEVFTGDSKSFDAATVLIPVGLLSMVGSVPLFIAASKNKRKAENISAFLKIEHRSDVQQSSVVKTFYLAVSVKICLR